uniref:MULE transposase domain-containing protein n=1 Tax=Fagus sylvatica TaxID=28930 RepID=A0A2N9GGE9_FAGSY
MDFSLGGYSSPSIVAAWTGTEHKRAKFSIIRGKNKAIQFTDKQPLDDDIDVECGDFDNEAGLEEEDEDGDKDGKDVAVEDNRGDDDMDFWDMLLSGDEDLLDIVVAAYSQGMTSQPASELVIEPARETVIEPIREPEFEKDWDSELANNDDNRPRVHGMLMLAGCKYIGQEKRATKKIDGSHKEQYTIRTGFKQECRPLIGLDECFLKGPYKRHLLSDVARDANDNMYLICVVVVESECKSSWSWFLDALLKDIREIKSGWAFISNRQKGLTESFTDAYPEMTIKMGKKKGVGTNAGGGASGSASAGTYGRVTSASGGVYGRVASATSGASGRGTGASASGGTSANGGGASRKAKVMVVPTVQKAMERIAVKTKKTT